MARIEGLPARDARPDVKLMYFFVRRGLAAATVHPSQHAIEPQQVYARLPGLRRRLNIAIGIGAPGFSKGMVCALPLKAAGG